jgi:hypothetical protein
MDYTTWFIGTLREITRSSTFTRLQESLSAAVVTLAGVSSGLSVAILPLLQAGIDARSALDVTEPRLTGHDEIEGTICDRLEGARCDSCGDAGAHVQIWIARTDSMIRRVVEDFVVNPDDRSWATMEASMRDAGASDAQIARIHELSKKPFSTLETVTYHPRCNETIAPEALQAKDASL